MTDRKIGRSRGVVSISFDNMGSASSIVKGQRTTQEDDDPSVVLGYPRILRLLDEHKVKSNFFIEGWNVLHNPDLVKEVHVRGHTIGLHGWMHEPYHLLSRADAERVIYDSIAAFRLLGIAPRGFRAPGGNRGPHCEDVLRKFEVEFDSSIDQNASALEPGLLASGVPNVPWQWPMIDFYQYHMHPDGEQSPEAVLALYSKTVEDVAQTAGYAAFIFHAFVTGLEESRLAVLDALFHQVLTDDRLELASVHDIAQRISAGR